MGKVKAADPDSVLAFTHDWSDWLSGSDTISTSTWSVDPTGELVVDSESETSTTATVVVSSMVKGHRYELINHIVTAAGEECDRTITVRSGNR
jgi:hypothetical protein